MAKRLLVWLCGSRWRMMAALALLATLVCCAIAWRDTMADPVIQRTEVTLPGLAQGTPPMTILLMSDLHVANPDMPPARLARIVDQVNALKPDLVVIAGDLVTDRLLATRHYGFREALAPLAGLKPRLGTVAVLGNHDYWRNADEARHELQRIGVEVLVNSHTARGPVIIGGVDDGITSHSNEWSMLADMPKDHGSTIIVSHSPDVFPRLPLSIPLVLAGHTHCGQVRWPWGGSPTYGSVYGARYACGRFDEWGGRVLVVTAGLGTSVLPFRFLVKPDMWLITVRPPQK